MARQHSRDSSLADDYYNHSLYSETTDTDAFPLPPGHDYGAVRKQASLAQIQVPSFRSFASSIPIPSPKATKRKPAPFQLAHSPRAASFSLAEKASPRLAEPASRPYSLASPLPQQSNGATSVLSPPLTEEYTARQEDRASYHFPQPVHQRTESIDARLADSDRNISSFSLTKRSSIPVHARYAHEQTIAHAPQQSVSSIDYSEYSESPVKSKEELPMHVPQAPSMTLQFDGIKRTLSDESFSSQTQAPRPKSPGSRLGSFFGWNSSSKKSTGTESPTTTFSDRSHSPLPSPHLEKPMAHRAMNGSVSTARLTPPSLDVHRANARTSMYFDNPDTPILIGSPETNAHVRELEKELAEVSTELAGSIRREMDLEDEIDRLRAELPDRDLPEDLQRRSSDYFSDSGASSTRYPVGDPDARVEQLEQKLRKIEQEKAQIKVDAAATLQAELARRRDLELMLQDVEEQLHTNGMHGEERGLVEGRMAELETSLGEAKRRLSQERQAKDQFGDLYSATILELEQHKNDRDNLRDEVVPQMRAQIEGLEAEAADTQALMYENTRMQQELAQLREEVQKLQTQSANARFTSIAEEDVSTPITGRGSLSRSNSLARSTNRPGRGGSITRSGSIKEAGRQRSGSVSAQPTTPVTIEGVKEVEDQRDALHKALRLLIRRYEKQQRDHERAIKKLRVAKDTAEQATPKRAGYHREVSFLKDEVTTLRKRTEDALEQKWQYEKGLSGIKMDLDRAEQETLELRTLLKENDILAPARQSISSAYSDDEAAVHNVKISISTAETERDQARQIAAEYRHRAQSVDPNSSQELMSSAQRMDELADQLERQVQANVQLRDRLADAVSKGEQEQRESTRQIEEMQKRLAGMEDSVLAAQQHSETMLGNHESEVRRIEESSSPQLQRLRISIPEPKLLSPKSPLFAKTPRLSTKMSESSLLEAGRTQMLERKVKELEGLLKEAEDDMQTVVQRVNRSQLEVAELQTERDAALTQMRKLQGLIVEERERAEVLMG